MVEPPKIKGVALRNFRAVLADVCEPQDVERVDAKVPREVREALDRGRIVSGGWYLLDWYKAMHSAAREVLHAGPSLPRKIGRESTRRDLTGIYRIFLQMVSPQLMVSLSSRIFGLYYSEGSMRVAEKRDGYARVDLVDCLGFDENIWQDVLGASELALELAGAKNVRMRIDAGGRNGDTSTTLVAHWTD
jgi:hypothetical protein